jgi:hypothetical protein
MAAWSGQDARVLRMPEEQLPLMLSPSRQTSIQSPKELESTDTLRRGRGAIEVIDQTQFW